MTASAGHGANVSSCSDLPFSLTPARSGTSATCGTVKMLKPFMKNAKSAMKASLDLAVRQLLPSFGNASAWTGRPEKDRVAGSNIQ